MSNIHGFSDYPPNNNNNRSGQYIVRSDSTSSNIGKPVSLEVSNTFPQQSQNQNPSRARNYSQTCLNYFFPKFSWRTFTFGITIVQIIVFIATLIDEARKDKYQGTWTCVLYRYGANYTPAINVYHHYHRLILPIFLHGGWLHIFFNLLTQLMYGFKLEDFYGTKKFAALYFISGVGGNLLSSVTHPQDNVSIGASSALFGIFALYLSYLIQHYKELGPQRNMIIGFMVVVIIANLATIGAYPNIDGTAHLGKKFSFLV